MNERTKQFRVGVVVLATIMITSILILWNSDFSALPFRSKYQIKLLVDQAPGVAPNTPVRRRGLPIGRVASVEDTDDGALITINVDADKVIKSNETARIQSSLVGDAVIEFMPTRGAAGAQQLAPDAVVRGTYLPNPMDLLATLQGDLRQTIITLGNAGEEVAELADRVNSVLGAGEMQRLTRLVESADRALVQFGSVAQNVNDILGDEAFKEQLKAGFGQFPNVINDARELLNSLDRAITSADENLKNLQGLTGPLGNRGTAIVATMENSIRNLEALLAEVAKFTNSINQSEGTVGMLIRERGAYDQLQATLAQANATITDVRCLINNEKFLRRIEMILDNIWVLTDKLQRDPARVIRGVVNRETPLNPVTR